MRLEKYSKFRCSDKVLLCVTVVTAVLFAVLEVTLVLWFDWPVVNMLGALLPVEMMLVITCVMIYQNAKRYAVLCDKMEQRLKESVQEEAEKTK